MRRNNWLTKSEPLVTMSHPHFTKLLLIPIVLPKSDTSTLATIKRQDRRINFSTLGPEAAFVVLIFSIAFGKYRTFRFLLDQFKWDQSTLWYCFNTPVNADECFKIYNIDKGEFGHDNVFKLHRLNSKLLSYCILEGLLFDYLDKDMNNDNDINNIYQCKWIEVMSIYKYCLEIYPSMQFISSEFYHLPNVYLSGFNKYLNVHPILHTEHLSRYSHIDINTINKDDKTDGSIASQLRLHKL